MVVQASSAGFNAGNEAQITINNKPVILEKNENDNYRGFHIVVINPQDGEV